MSDNDKHGGTLIAIVLAGLLILLVAFQMIS